jgi:amino acid transporter
VRGAQGSRLDALSGGGRHAGTELRAIDVLRRAAHVYRVRFRRVFGLAVVVFGLTAVLDAFVETRVDNGPLNGTTEGAVVEVFVAVFATIGLLAYAGILDLALHDHLHDVPDRPLRRALADLPLGRLLVADALVTATTLAGYALLVVPGVILFTLLSLTGPLVGAEDLRPLEAVRRSAQLVRMRFLLVLVLVTVPATFEEDVVHAIDYHSFGSSLLAAFVVTGVAGAVVMSCIGLVEVVLAHELAARVPAEG